MQTGAAGPHLKCSDLAEAAPTHHVAPLFQFAYKHLVRCEPDLGADTYFAAAAAATAVELLI